MRNSILNMFTRHLQYHIVYGCNAIYNVISQGMAVMYTAGSPYFLDSINRHHIDTDMNCRIDPVQGYWQ